MIFPVRHGIAFRTALALITFTLLAGAISIGFIGFVAYERSRQDIDARLRGLLDTVASTASAACFVQDMVLAKDIAQGLVKNSVVQGAVIISSSVELANLSRNGTPLRVEDIRTTGVSRPIFSPFEPNIQVGEIIVQPNLDELDRLNRNDLGFITSVLLLQLIAIIVAAIYAVFRWVVLPMKNMSDLLHKMSDTESDTLPIPAGHEKTEIGRLVEDINELTAHLAHAREQSEKANQAKGNFLANMSHEIRTPINAVVGLAHLVLKTKLTDKQRDYLQKIRDSGGHLLELVNEILDVAKIEAGKLQLELTPFKMNQLIQRIQSIAEVKANEKGLALNVTVDAEIPTDFYGDSMRIGQILLNFINNAIKFTDKGSVSLRILRLKTENEHCHIRFEVSDTGIGLTQEQMNRLFRSFEQADVSTTRKFGGTGLGLAICKQLAGLMGGHVGVDSRYGEGSTFWATLRLEMAPAGSTDSSDPMQGEAAFLPERLKGLHILVAEDNQINQQITRELLEEYGITVTIAENGREAIAQLADQPVDCILMDVRMPEMDGIEATRLIRANPDTAHMPIIAMTANARLEDRAECAQAGMNDFISKPVDPPQFFRVLLRCLNLQSNSTDWAVNLPAEPEINPEPANQSLTDEINTTVIAAMVKNNPEKIIRFVQTFLISTRPGIAGIQQAVAGGDMAHLTQTGHRFKASCHSMGATRLSELMKQLEAQAKAQDLRGIEDTVAKIELTWQRIEVQMATYITQLENSINSAD